ncbi:hypothetical protein N3K63_12720 [Microbacterium sp. W1N]|uniref:hypothetical protein n=1 Tax=Microbacterium festucae TaxID=2977531 RepID=UPI0021C237DC|nr:hypothetical protein [Microbacterium festucae]MCT9821142.1 hypothetical protein [Microbacterium festucae]
MVDDASELAALRARAYGADADIHDDPDALRRLTALEEAGRRARTAPPAPPLVTTVPRSGGTPRAHRAPATATPTDAGASADPDGVDALGSAPPENDEPPVRRWRTAALLLACAATAVVTAALTAGVVLPLSLLAGDTSPRPIAVLHVDPDAEGDETSPGDGAARYDDFYGMRISSGEYDETGGRCITIMPDAALSGTSTGVCSAPGLEPSIDLTVMDGQVGEGVIERYAPGTTLRFTLAGDEVRVYISEPPAT